MNNAKPAYLTIGGRPLCLCEGNVGGLMTELRVTCGHRSLAAAHRAKRLLQVRRHSVRVVPGHCPVVASTENNGE